MTQHLTILPFEITVNHAEYVQDAYNAVLAAGAIKERLTDDLSGGRFSSSLWGRGARGEGKETYHVGLMRMERVIVNETGEDDPCIIPALGWTLQDFLERRESQGIPGEVRLMSCRMKDLLALLCQHPDLPGVDSRVAIAVPGQEMDRGIATASALKRGGKLREIESQDPAFLWLPVYILVRLAN